MSEKRLSLKSPIVVAAVLVLLALVLVANIRTFGPAMAGGRNSAAQAPGEFPLPMDLDQIMRRAAMAGGDGIGSAGPALLPNLDRDPFRNGNTVAAAPVERGVARPPVAANPNALVCEAIVLGGRQPLALINGAALAIGDRVRDYRIERIATDGVSLKSATGKLLFLAVGQTNGTIESYRMVTSVPDPGNHGRTALDDDEERRRP